MYLGARDGTGAFQTPFVGYISNFVRLYLSFADRVLRLQQVWGVALTSSSLASAAQSDSPSATVPVVFYGALLVVLLFITR